MLEYLEFQNQDLETLETKVCIRCKFERPVSKSFFKLQKNKLSFQKYCKICISIEAKEHRKANLEIYKKRRRDYYLKVKNTKEFKLKQEQYKDRYNELERKRYREKRIKEGKSLRENVQKIRTEFYFRSVGTYIKERVNCRYLGYSTEELIRHIESKFEWWMTWDNWGVYSARKWKDDDPSTWVWNIDHIIPYSDLPYTSPDDENFKKCWALENLRPYSGKYNIRDGASRARHNPNKKRIRIVKDNEKINYEKIKKENELKEKVKELFSSGLRSRQISKQIGISKTKVLSIYKLLNISKEEMLEVNKKPLPSFKVCKLCKIDKDINLFRIRVNSAGNLQAEPKCKDCESLLSKCQTYIEYHNIKEYENDLKEGNYERLLELSKNYKKYTKRGASDSFVAVDFRIRSFIARNLMKDVNYKYLDYGMKELREHMEKSFVEGINWENFDEKWSIIHKEKFDNIKEYYALNNMVLKIKP